MKELNEQWSELKEGLLQGLSASKRKMVAPLLENQRLQILNETATTGSVDTSAIANFRKIMIPMIRRVIPNAIATELVGVQPMQAPVGLVYSMRFKYQDAINPGAGIDRAIPGTGYNGQPDYEAFGNTNMLRRFYSGQTDAAVPLGLTAGDGSGFPGTNPITGVPNGHGWGSLLDAAHVGANKADGSLYGGGGSYLEGSGGRKMGMEVISQAVEARSRKLQASWTIEAMQDLQNQHGLDIENEMTQAMSAEIVQEIDNEIINDLMGLAGTIATFNGAVPAVGSPQSTYKPTFVGDRLANLGVIINYVANEIGRRTRRNQANWIVVSPMIVSVLQTASKSVFAPAVEGSFQGPNNTKLVGTLNGSIKVYSYLWNDVRTTDMMQSPGYLAGTGDDTILVGYKGGNGETDSGYFYCPYVPLMSSGVIVNPITTQPMVSLMTRYGKAVFDDRYMGSSANHLNNSSDYYGKITVTDLSLV